jgi:hypothetical protein
MVYLGEKEVDIVSRRSISNQLRLAVIGSLPADEYFDDPDENGDGQSNCSSELLVVVQGCAGSRQRIGKIGSIRELFVQRRTLAQ